MAVKGRDMPLTFEGIALVEQQCAPGDMNLAKAMVEHIMRVLRQTKGKIGGQGGVTEHLGMNLHTLQSCMKMLNIPFGRSCKSFYGGQGQDMHR